MSQAVKGIDEHQQHPHAGDPQNRGGKAKPGAAEMRPAATGRRAVRAMRMSISASAMWLTTRRGGRHQGDAQGAEHQDVHRHHAPAWPAACPPLRRAA